MQREHALWGWDRATQLSGTADHDRPYQRSRSNRQRRSRPVKEPRAWQSDLLWLSHAHCCPSNASGQGMAGSYRDGSARSSYEPSRVIDSRYTAVVSRCDWMARISATQGKYRASLTRSRDQRSAVRASTPNVRADSPGIEHPVSRTSKRASGCCSFNRRAAAGGPQLGTSAASITSESLRRFSDRDTGLRSRSAASRPPSPSGVALLIRV